MSLAYCALWHGRARASPIFRKFNNEARNSNSSFGGLTNKWVFPQFIDHAMSLCAAQYVDASNLTINTCLFK